MFKFIESRPQSVGIVDNLAGLSTWQLYAQMIYFGLGVQGCCPNGDQVPFTPLELVLGYINQIWARILIVVINS
jgi:hypothetical protein